MKLKKGVPDYIFYNGSFLSLDDENHIYSAVAVKDGVITNVYDGEKKLPKRGFGTTMIDLHGKTVIPGFIDCNVHVIQSGMEYFCEKIESVNEEDFFNKLTEKSQNYKEGELIWCTGIKEEYSLNRWDLDQLFPCNPIIASGTEFHTTVVNTGAYNLLRIPSNLPGVEKDSCNMPTGVMWGNASGMVRRRAYEYFIHEDLQQTAISYAVSDMVKNGITTANAMEGGFFFNDSDITAVNSYNLQSPIELLVFPQVMDLDFVTEHGFPRIGGNIYLDGTIASKTAALYENYLGESYNGLLYYSQEDIDSFIIKAHNKKLQVSLSCIGERAIDQALAAFEAAYVSTGENERRDRIELFVLPTEEQIKRAIAMNIIFSMRPNYDSLWGGENGMYCKHIGDRYKHANPLRGILKEGGKIALGSESAVTPLNPLMGIHSCVNHHQEEQRLDVLNALKMYTVNGAYANFLEDRLGKISFGYQADMAVLSHNPLEVDPADIAGIEVIRTIKRGKTIYERWR